MIDLSFILVAQALLFAALLLFGGLSLVQPMFRVAAIPDELPTELARKAAQLMRSLKTQLGMKVEFAPQTDYAAAVEALVNRKVDIAWFGGFTFVRAQVRSGGKAIPIAQRKEEKGFRSIFAASDPTIKQLTDLRTKDVTFGSQSSPPRDLTPRSCLLRAAPNRDKDIRRVAYSDAHDSPITSPR